MSAQPIPRIATKAAALEPWQQSLKEARHLAKMVLGHAASTVVAERQSGIYRGVVIGHTRDYIIQQIGRQAAAVLHAKDSFPGHGSAFPWPEVGRAFTIRYSHSRAIAREIREGLQEQELSR